MTIVRLFLLTSLFITCLKFLLLWYVFLYTSHIIISVLIPFPHYFYVVIIHSFVIKFLCYYYVNLYVVSLHSFVMSRRYLLLSFTIHVVFLVLWYFLSGLVVWNILVLFVSLMFTHSLSSNLLINSLSISFSPLRACQSIGQQPSAKNRRYPQE